MASQGRLDGTWFAAARHSGQDGARAVRRGQAGASSLGSARTVRARQARLDGARQVRMGAARQACPVETWCGKDGHGRHDKPTHDEAWTRRHGKAHSATVRTGGMTNGPTGKALRLRRYFQTGHTAGSGD